MAIFIIWSIKNFANKSRNFKNPIRSPFNKDYKQELEGIAMNLERNRLYKKKKINKIFSLQ